MFVGENPALQPLCPAYDRHLRRRRGLLCASAWVARKKHVAVARSISATAAMAAARLSARLLGSTGDLAKGAGRRLVDIGDPTADRQLEHSTSA